MYQFKTTCTSARNIALDQNKRNQFKIILNLNYNIAKERKEIESVTKSEQKLFFDKLKCFQTSNYPNVFSFKAEKKVKMTKKKRKENLQREKKQAM